MIELFKEKNIGIGEISRNISLSFFSSEIFDILYKVGRDTTEIDEILLVGGETRIVGIKDLLKRNFGEEKVKDNLIVDEVVALGASLEFSIIEKEISLLNIYNIGIWVENSNPKD